MVASRSDLPKEPAILSTILETPIIPRMADKKQVKTIRYVLQHHQSSPGSGLGPLHDYDLLLRPKDSLTA